MSTLGNNVKQRFLDKVKFAKTLPALDDNQLKLKMYAYYKQATVGDCNTSKPGMLDFVGKYKWDAWNSMKSMEPDAAMEAYMEIVDDLSAKAGVSSENHVDVQVVNEDVKVECNENGLVEIVLNRPKKYNALKWDMYLDIQNALEKYKLDANVRAVCIRANGKMFCSTKL